MLCLVEYTLFSDKSGIRDSILYLRLFENLCAVSTFAWGTTTLAYLYKKLGYTFRDGVKQIVNYLPLLDILLVS